MPVAGQPGLPAPEDTQVAPATSKQQQQGANELARAAPGTDELAGLDLSGAETVRDVPFTGFDSDEDELLFGPTSRPDERMAHVRPSGRTRVPEGLAAKLPMLLEAARQPDAPRELHAFLRILAYEMGQEY